MTVFVLRDEQLIPLEPTEFATEYDFQSLLEKFPKLLTWEQNDADMPRQWLLLKREKAVPAEDGGSGRWSVDHLFVDQDGVPTLVEVKRQIRYPASPRSRQPDARLCCECCRVLAS
jgi:hypothetical protein